MECVKMLIVSGDVLGWNEYGEINFGEDFKRF